MDHATSYSACGHPDERGWPAGDAFGRAVERVKYPQQAFDLLMSAVGPDRAYTVLLTALEDLHACKRVNDESVIERWYERETQP